MSPMVNDTIGHYRILRQLGSGGMGLVYEAEDTKLGRRVALKFLQDSSTKDPAAVERFLREARSASALNHPGICTIHAIEENEGRTYIAMELLEGESLEKVLSRGPFPLLAPSRSASKSPTRSTPPTKRASSIETSSPPISSSPIAATPKSSISASPNFSSPKAPTGRRDHRSFSGRFPHQSRNHCRHHRLHVSRTGARRGS